MQLPLLVLPVGQGHALVTGDDAASKIDILTRFFALPSNYSPVVDGHDSLSVHSNPGNLKETCLMPSSHHLSKVEIRLLINRGS